MTLSGLRSQDVLCLPRHLFAIPKVLFNLRSAPCFLSNQLEAFDGLLRSLLLSILNINLDHDASWLQATLPVCAGALWVRRAAQMAPSAFLASAVGCSSLILEILPPLRSFLHVSMLVLTLTLSRPSLLVSRVTRNLRLLFLSHHISGSGMLHS